MVSKQHFYILMLCLFTAWVVWPILVEAETVTFEVSGFANLYQQTNPNTQTTHSIDPIKLPIARLCPNQQIQITATGCVVDYHSGCTGPDGHSGNFRGLPVYSLIGRWSRSPQVLDDSTVASDPFFIGSSVILTAPPEPGNYYLFLGENDGIFDDNSGAYKVSATWTQLPTCQSDIGIPQVTAVSPISGGNSGTVTVTIWGSGFQEGAMVRLVEGNEVVPNRAKHHSKTMDKYRDNI